MKKFKFTTLFQRKTTGDHEGRRKGSRQNLGGANDGASIPASSLPPALMLEVSDFILARIFAFVCPHSQDEGYDSNEASAPDHQCMLCDLRDVAHCAQTCRQWKRVALGTLYHSIRIDPVHYCAREGVLADQRKRKSWANQNADPEAPAEMRVRLLCRTLRNDITGVLGATIQFLKIGYMAREGCIPDLARIVAVTPNLKYMDLPRGCYTDDFTCAALIAELQGSCRDLRKMKFKPGAEKNLESLIQNNHWANLEVLELKAINLNTMTFRSAVGALKNLRALRIRDMPAFSNDVFANDASLPMFPALDEFVLENIPNISAAGLCDYLARSDTQNALGVLSLMNTGVQLSTINHVLATAPSLRQFTIVEHIATSFPTYAGVPPLSSDSIELLRFEITSDTPSTMDNSPSQSYYAYLRSSILANGLPKLATLFVRDPTFSDCLASSSSPNPVTKPDVDNDMNQHARFSSNNPFAAVAQPQAGFISPAMHELEIYTKSSSDQLGWSQSFVSPGSHGLSVSRPKHQSVSSFGLGTETSMSWTEEAGARRSVVVGDGSGNFLAVPDLAHAQMQQQNMRSDSSRPGVERTASYDLWR